MNVYEVKTMGERIEGNSYVGRGIVIGKTADGKKAATAYFIMGRSENSRNRVFTVRDGAVFTEPFDASKVEDPSLIIYAAVRKTGNHLIVTNGDQTDTVMEGLQAGKSYIEALRTRCYEPDPDNYTPRISGVLAKDGSYCLSILKSADGDPNCNHRFFYEYDAPIAGTGHFIHTYQENLDPLPSFEGEPRKIVMGDVTAKSFADEIWANLNPDNKVSLFVQTIDLASGERDTVIINKHN